jgi:Rrf2 family protein
MFKLNRRTDYAIRLMIELARGPERIKASDLSAIANVPAPFTHKIVRDLVRSGLVWTTSGPEGGAGLARPAGQINLLEIMEAMEGPIQLNFCRVGPTPCQYPNSAQCPVHPVWEKVQTGMQEQLRQTSLTDLLQNMVSLADQGR